MLYCEHRSSSTHTLAVCTMRRYPQSPICPSLFNSHCLQDSVHLHFLEANACLLSPRAFAVRVDTWCLYCSLQYFNSWCTFLPGQLSSSWHMSFCTRCLRTGRRRHSRRSCNLAVKLGNCKTRLSRKALRITMACDFVNVQLRLQYRTRDLSVRIRTGIIPDLRAMKLEQDLFSHAKAHALSQCAPFRLPAWH